MPWRKDDLRKKRVHELKTHLDLLLIVPAEGHDHQRFNCLVRYGVDPAQTVWLKENGYNIESVKSKTDRVVFLGITNYTQPEALALEAENLQNE